MEWVARREGARSNADAAEDGSIESRISLSRLDLEKSTPLSRWPRDRQSLDHRRLSRSPAPSFFYLYFICFFLLFSLPLLFSCSLGALCLGLSLALPLARVYFSRSPLRSPSLPTPPFLFLCFCLFLFLPLSVCLSICLTSCFAISVLLAHDARLSSLPQCCRCRNHAHAALAFSSFDSQCTGRSHRLSVVLSQTLPPSASPPAC